MSEQHFEPEVLALLDEIARSPDATLLRIPRERLLRYVGQPEEMVSPHGSWLTKAEKHLVTAYREQAARVLLEACILRLKEDPLFFSPIMPQQKGLRSRAERVVQSLPPGDQAASILRHFAKNQGLSASALVAASMRLAPSVASRCALAVSHECEGFPMTAIRVSKVLLGSNPPPHQRAQALENMASAYVALQDFRAAFEFNHLASMADDRPIRFLAWSFTTAIQGGQEDKALESARRLEAHPMSADLPPLLQALRVSRAKRAWTPSENGMRIISKIRRRLSERSMAICAVFS